MDKGLNINEGKSEFTEYKNMRFQCFAIKTAVIGENDSLPDIVREYALPVVRAGDIVFMSEKMVSCTEGRALPLDSIKAGRLARFLCRFVKKSDYGIGLAMPETMQCAIDEVGALRILAAAAVGALGRLFHKKGWFYKAAGRKAAAIDGPCSYTLPPYNRYVVLSPKEPNSTAKEISHILSGCEVLIIDANDLGCEILGSSEDKCDVEMYKALLWQNPLGQSTQQTPIGILRRCEDD